VIGFFFLGLKALAEFRQAHRLSDDAESMDTSEKPQSNFAA